MQGQLSSCSSGRSARCGASNTKVVQPAPSRVHNSTAIVLTSDTAFRTSGMGRVNGWLKPQGCRLCDYFFVTTDDDDRLAPKPADAATREGQFTGIQIRVVA
jgi:hypothetical protein